jgi:uncharacterized DUF497 family protein
MVHPADAESWEWDDGNEFELARHGISSEEVEQVFWNDPVWVPNRRAGSGNWKMLGDSNGGRRLTVVLHFDADRSRLRPITGWKCTRAERTKYF